MGKLKPLIERFLVGSVLIDVLIAMIIISVSLIVIFTGIAQIGKQASTNRKKVLDFIDQKSEYYRERKIQFSEEDTE